MYNSLAADFQQYPKGTLFLHDAKNDAFDETSSFPQIEKAIAVLAFTLPGVPYLSNSSEIDNKKRNFFYTLCNELSTIRRNHPALQSGEYLNVQNSDCAHLLTFIRFSGKDSVLVVINLTQMNKEEEIQMPPHSSLLWQDQISSVRIKADNSRLKVTVLPFTGLLLTPSSEKERR